MEKFIKMFLTAMLVIAGGVSAQINWRADNITITTEAQLRELATLVNNGTRDFSGQTIILANDINLVNGNWTSIGWIQEGPGENITKFPFNGTFDGNGNAVRGLEISTTNSYQGFFGLSRGAIKNLGVIGKIKGGYPAGGLVGINYGGTISNCYATVEVIGEEGIGGLVGVNYGGTITNCYATGNVGTFFWKESVGGLVGSNDGTITNCYATGNVNGKESVGGLVGSNDGTITNCYATGNVNGEESVGGLVGSNYGGAITNCYATGNVNGEESVGGLVGSNIDSVDKSNSYGTIINSYVLIGTSGRLVGLNEKEGRLVNSGFKTLTQMRQQNTFVGWDFTNIWQINANTNNGFPHLRNVGAGR